MPRDTSLLTAINLIGFFFGHFLENAMKISPPLLKSSRNEFMVPKDAQYSKRMHKQISDDFFFQQNVHFTFGPCPKLCLSVFVYKFASLLCHNHTEK